MGRYANIVQHAFRTMTYMPMAFITAKTGQERQGAVEPLAVAVQAVAQTGRHRDAQPGRSARPSTPIRPPPARIATPRIYYATQVDVAPPTIVLFVNSTRLFDPTYQRYLLNVFREKLPFHDIPIKLYLRSPQADRARAIAVDRRTDPADGDRRYRPDRRSRPSGECLPMPTDRIPHSGSSTMRSTSCSPTWTNDSGGLPRLDRRTSSPELGRGVAREAL